MNKLTTIKSHGFDRYDFEGKVSDVIARLQQLQKEYGDDIELDLDTYVEYDSAYVQVNVLRPETEQEAIDRKAKEAEQLAQWEAHQRAQYEQLKAKFESK